jgi:uncharacterized damage-inducible protein DinB
MSDVVDSMLVEFIRYNAWANLKLVEACEVLTAEELAAGAPGTYGTIYRTLEPLIDSEAFYYSLLTGEEVAAPLRWADKPTVAEIRAYCVEVGQAMIGAAGRVRPKDVVHQKREGGVDSYKALTLLIQTVNHGVEHRTNITTIMTALGLAAPEVDGWGYWWENQDRLGADARGGDIGK